MVATDFTEYFSANEVRFRELIANLKARSYVTDEDFRVSRCLFESVSQRIFDTVFKLHFPNQVNVMSVSSTAISRQPGEYVYVIYNADIYGDLHDIESKLRLDGVLDLNSI